MERNLPRLLSVAAIQNGAWCKILGHYTSTDLVNWQHEEAALAPSDWFDQNGCYSGSAFIDDGQMHVMYTGNVRDEQGNRETYQCLAVSEDGIHFQKRCRGNTAGRVHCSFSRSKGMEAKWPVVHGPWCTKLRPEGTPCLIYP